MGPGMHLSKINPKSDFLSATMHHSGSNTLRAILGGRATKIHVGYKTPHMTAHLGSRDWEDVKVISEKVRTVTSLRHPARIILSHLQRQSHENRTREDCGAMFWRQWQRMGQLKAFRFPIEVMPFDALEAFMGQPVVHTTSVHRSIGEYPEKHDMRLAKAYLGRLWAYVEMALETPDGQIYNSEDFHADY